MKYVKRTIAPTKDNKFYYSKDNIFYRSNYPLPNCTTYAWGRWFELLNKKPNLCIHQAESWYLKDDGYKRGKTPKLGAIACWSKGSDQTAKDGDGHVAVVEEIKTDGTIKTSNSAWNGTIFYMKELKPPYKLGGSYKFQGFIYIPIEFEEEKIENNNSISNSIVKFNLKRLLKYNSKGNDVKELQKALGGLVIDGIFGNATLNKVKSFQKSKKLVQDGIVGKNTATALGWSYGKFNLTRLLKVGTKGNDVKELQKALGGLIVDGIFGAKTLAKVKSYQKSKKLYQDGIVGKNTAHALNWLYLNK